MMKYKQQIKEYKEEIEKKYVRIEAENRTVKAVSYTHLDVYKRQG